MKYKPCTIHSANVQTDTANYKSSPRHRWGGSASHGPESTPDSRMLTSAVLLLPHWILHQNWCFICYSHGPSRTIFLPGILMDSFTPPGCAVSSGPFTNPRLCRECAFPPPRMFAERVWTNCTESSHVSREILPHYSESPGWGCFLPPTITSVSPPHTFL